MAKNYMQDVARMLGVELEEEFMVTEEECEAALPELRKKYLSETGADR